MKNKLRFLRIIAFAAIGVFTLAACSSAITDVSGESGPPVSDPGSFSLTENIWANGSITSTTSGNARYYHFNVTAGTT